MKPFAAAIICLGMTLPVSSLNPVFSQNLIAETEEQYARSQSARAEAITAFRAGDLEIALEGMKRALADRPTNTALLSNALFLAAETGKSEDAIAFANQFLALGLVPGAGIQAKMHEKFPADTWQAFKEKFAAAGQPTGNATNLFSVSTDHKLVEGIATDSAGTYFLSTVVSNTVLKVNPEGKISVLTKGADHAIGSFFGIAYSNIESALYVTHGRVDQTPNMPQGEGQTGVIRLDPINGLVTGDWSLTGGTKGQQIADVAISPDGVVYVSEAQGGAVYKVVGDALAKLDTKKQFRSPQGMAFLGDGHLYMADYGRGIWRINMKTDDAKLLAVSSKTSLIGIDGLLAHNGKLVAIQNGTRPHRIIEIELEATGKAIAGITVLAQNLVSFDEPTLGTSTAKGIAFVASSQWPKYAPDGLVREGQTVEPTSVMLLPY